MADLELSSFGDFRLGGWLVQPRLNRISRDHSVVTLELKVMRVLVCLAERAGDLVTRQELTDSVWAKEFIADNTVTHAIKELRKALGDDARDPTFIETIHRRGYRLLIRPGLASDNDSSISRTLSHYLLLEHLGGGGMGVVYRARDTKLGRDVALKFLPKTLTHDHDARQRFIREARTASALDHPNICTIHEIDETADGQLFIAMACYEGETLKKVIDRGPLPVDEAVRICSDIAEGLERAHEAGIIHRDIKPANIMVTSDGVTKIVDFGLAKLTPQLSDFEPETPADSLETMAGSVVGTAAYMSPEQASGGVVDQRTDIWSLGCVLYEMLTGEKAFKRGTTAETMAAILRDEPRSFAEASVRVSPQIEDAILLCLEKTPDKRLKSASDLVLALGSESRSPVAPIGSIKGEGQRKRWLALAGAVVAAAVTATGLWFGGDQKIETVRELDPRKVVVAVFENRTGDPSLDSLGILVSEALAEGASGIGDFSVIPSPASFGQRTVEVETNSGSQALRGLAEETGAGVVVSGGYYLLGDDLRFQAKLTDAIAGGVLQSAPAVVGPRNAQADVIESLRQRVLGATAWHFHTDAAQLFTPPLLVAYQKYLRVRQIFMQDLEEEVLLNRQMVELDPDFFVGWFNFHTIYSNRWLCDQAAQILVEMKPRAAGFTPFERLHIQRAQFRLTGRTSEALQTTRKMNNLSGGQLSYEVGLFEIWANHPRAAAATLSRIEYPADAAPPSRRSWTFWWLARAHHMLGEYEEELRVAETSLEHFPLNSTLYGRKAAALAALGRFEGLGRVIDDMELAQTENGIILVMLDAAGELRAHGHRQAALLMAERAVAWIEVQPSDMQLGLRPALADALTHAERWSEAKYVADKVLHEPHETGGWVGREEGDRTPGFFWWGDLGHVVALGRVGTLAARLGDRDEAQSIAIHLRDFDSSCPSGNRTYQRALIACQLGDRDEAIRLLKNAVSQGYNGFWGMRADINLEPLWDDPEFLELVRPKG